MPGRPIAFRPPVGALDMAMVEQTSDPMTGMQRENEGETDVPQSPS
jgi:hypothetical protein